MSNLEEGKAEAEAAFAAHGEPAVPTTATPISPKKLLEGRFYILRGLLMLLVGSILLLTCKTPLPGFLSEILAFLGGVIILFGNGYILFGLLIFADSRNA